ncbi:hypothetical protein DFJ77DRAFT_505782 [Powellomyces hirtus]|nr:hypothetical protein DFJ77DRAFT_505782 [Powellomyces hirtus]
MITTHVLDTTNGIAAKDVAVKLEILTSSNSAASQDWQVLAEGCATLLPGTAESGPHTLAPGIYKMNFATKEYFARFKSSFFFPFAQLDNLNSFQALLQLDISTNAN